MERGGLIRKFQSILCNLFGIKCQNMPIASIKRVVSVIKNQVSKQYQRVQIEEKYQKLVSQLSEKAWAEPTRQTREIQNILKKIAHLPPAKRNPDPSCFGDLNIVDISTYQYLPSTLMNPDLGSKALKYLLVAADTGTGKSFILADFIYKALVVNRNGISFNRKIVCVFKSGQNKLDVLRDVMKHKLIRAKISSHYTSLQTGLMALERELRSNKQVTLYPKDDNSLSGYINAGNVFMLSKAKTGKFVNPYANALVIMDEFHEMFMPEEVNSSWADALITFRAYVEYSMHINSDWHFHPLFKNTQKFDSFVALTATPIPGNLERFGSVINMFSHSLSVGGTLVKISNGPGRYGKLNMHVVKKPDVFEQFLERRQILSGGGQTKKQIADQIYREHGIQIQKYENYKKADLINMANNYDKERKRDKLYTNSLNTNSMKGCINWKNNRNGNSLKWMRTLAKESSYTFKEAGVKQLARLLSGFCYYYSADKDINMYAKSEKHPFHQVLSVDVVPYAYPTQKDRVSGTGGISQSVYLKNRRMFAFTLVNAMNPKFPGMVHYLNSRPPKKTLIFCADAPGSKGDYTRDVFAALLVAKKQGWYKGKQPLRLVVVDSSSSKKRYVLPHSKGKYISRGVKYHFHVSDKELIQKALDLETHMSKRWKDLAFASADRLIKEYYNEKLPVNERPIMVLQNHFSTGKTFRGTQELHVAQGMETTVKFTQTIGRAIRRCAHAEYKDMKDWIVDVHSWEPRGFYGENTCETALNQMTKRQRELHFAFLRILWNSSFTRQAFEHHSPNFS